MAEYVCVPAAYTVHPCPSGSAPQVSILSADPLEYPDHFLGHVPVQDLLAVAFIAFAFFVGYVGGRG